jgi:alpha/beta superfamily hydrolase
VSTIESLRIRGPAGPLEAVLKNPPDTAGSLSSSTEHRRATAEQRSRSSTHEGSSAPPFAAVVCHPHPLHGGTMHNKVVFHLAKALNELGAPALRFNFRGVGTSAGSYAEGIGERDDAQAALEYLATRYPDTPLCLAGFSFGNWVGSAVGCADDRVTQIVAAGTTTRLFENSALRQCAKRKLLLQGDRDEFGPVPELEAFYRLLPEPKQLEVIEGADHYFSGRLDELRAAVATYFATEGLPPELTQTVRDRGPSNSQR